MFLPSLRVSLRWSMLAAVLGAVSWSAQASSTAASSASDSASSTASSASDSLGKSSTSSSPGDDVADGDYRVIDMAEATDRPGRMRLTLQGVAAAGKPGTGTTFELYLPVATLAQAALTTGQQIRTRQRPYGIEFARADAAAPFFLALHDTWHRELASHPVAL
jgi:hypothetical protein